MADHTTPLDREEPPLSIPGWRHHAFATWTSRVSATLIDSIGALLCFALLLGIGIAFESAGAPRVLYSSFWFLAFLGALLVAPVAMTVTGGQSLGKLALGIRVVRTNGKRVGISWSALREIPVKQLLGLLLFLDVLWPLWDRENRALHDLVVGSRVIRHPRSDRTVRAGHGGRLEGAQWRCSVCGETFLSRAEALGHADEVHVEMEDRAREALEPLSSQAREGM